MSDQLTDQRAEDARRALAVSALIQAEVQAVLARYADRIDGYGALSARYLVLHALMEVIGRQLVEAQQVDPDRARAWTQRTLDHLSMYTAPAAHRAQ
jgi:hypothetical protein